MSRVLRTTLVAPIAVAALSVALSGCGGSSPSMTASSTSSASSSAAGASDGVFGWRRDNTVSARRAIERARAGGPASILVIGDSISQGYTSLPTGSAGMNFPAAWPWKLRELLAADGIVIGGTGWVPTGSASTYPKDPRISLTGTWDDPAGSLATTQAGASLTFTSDVVGTNVKVAYPSASGPFTVAIDDGPAVAVTPSGDAGDVGVYSVTVADTTHTVKIVSTSGVVAINALQVSSAGGLQIHNMSCIGMSARVWAADIVVPRDRGFVTNRLPDLQKPDVVVIMLGVNDLSGKRTPDQIAEDVTAIGRKYPDSTVVIAGESQPNPEGSSLAPTQDAWTEFHTKMKAVAEQQDWPFLDMYDRTGGSFEAAEKAGYMVDWMHSSATWQSDFASMFASLLTKPV